MMVVNYFFYPFLKLGELQVYIITKVILLLIFTINLHLAMRLVMLLECYWICIKYMCMSWYYYNYYERYTGDIKVIKFDIDEH